MNTPARLKTIARELDGHAIDVVCLQEVQYSRYVPLLTRNFATFPFVAFEPFLYSPKGGLLTLSQRPIKQSAFTLYPERGWWHTPSLTDRLLHKGILATELTYAGQQVLVLNTHLTANYNGDWSRTNRYARLERTQLHQLAHVVNGLAPEALVIIAGDFNFPRHSWLYEEFVEATGVIDPLNGQMKPTYYPFLGLPERYQQPIDHIFIRPAAGTALTVKADLRFEEELALISGRWGRVSDHAAIEVSVQWQPTTQSQPAGEWSLPELSYRV